MSPKESIVISKIRQDEWVNPFGASPEELLAGALDEAGLLDEATKINGKSGQDVFKAYVKRRNLFQEATKLGNILVKEGVLEKAQLQAALRTQANSGMPLGEVLVSKRLCSEADIEMALTRQKTIREEYHKLEKAESERRSLWKNIKRFLLDAKEEW